MEWLPYIHDALEYIEGNLLTVNSPKEVASRLNISEPVLQKGFQGITGYNVMEYIRYRRLYEASLEMTCSDIKVTDAAYKYGYDSVDGFTRAFIRFHGISPSALKKKGTGYRRFPALSVDIVLYGEAKSSFKVMRKSRHRFVGFKKEIKKENALEEIQCFWDEFYKKYRVDDEEGKWGENKYIYENGIGEYGIIINETKDTYTYMIAGRQISSEITEELEVLDIEETRWAVFDFYHPVVEGLQGIASEKLEQQINQTSGYEVLGNVRVEWYEGLDRNRKIEGYRSSVWIPISEQPVNNGGKHTIRKINKWIVLAVLILLAGLGGILGIRPAKPRIVPTPESRSVEDGYVLYYTVNIGGTIYELTAGELEDEIGEFIGTYEAEGISDIALGQNPVPECGINNEPLDTADSNTIPKSVKKKVRVYEIEGVDRNFAVAVYLEDKDEYVIYRNLDFIEEF